MTQRRLENWLETFKKWTMPRSETPESMLEWCGLFTLAAVIRRHVVITEEYLGGWKCYPSLFIKFIAPQGVVKKSTSIGFVETLLDEIPDLSKSPDGVTIAELLKRIQDADESSVYILSSEFSTLVLKAGLGIYDILTDLYDGKKKIDEGTISRGYIFADSPCMNFLAATTPRWVGANMTEDIIGGGYGSRIIAIHESEPRHRTLLYNKILKNLGSNYVSEMQADLIHDLNHIATIKGEFIITEAAQDFLDGPNGWYKKNAEAPKGTDSKMVGYYQRRPAHIFKVAMLSKIAWSDELILDVPDFENAIAVMTRTEPKIAAMYRSIGRNVYVVDMNNIIKFIAEQQNGRVSRTELLRTFNSAAEPLKLDEIITQLMQMEYIKPVVVEKEMWYQSMESI